MVTARTRARRQIRLYAPVPRIRGAHPYIAVNLSAIEPGDPIGTPVGTVVVVNSDDASHTYALTNDAGGRFQINPTTGEITLAAEAEAGVYAITIQATGAPSGAVTTRILPIPFVLLETNWLVPMMLLQEL